MTPVSSFPSHRHYFCCYDHPKGNDHALGVMIIQRVRVWSYCFSNQQNYSGWCDILIWGPMEGGTVYHSIEFAGMMSSPPPIKVVCVHMYAHVPGPQCFWVYKYRRGMNGCLKQLDILGPLRRTFRFLKLPRSCDVRARLEIANLILRDYMLNYKFSRYRGVDTKFIYWTLFRKFSLLYKSLS